MTGSNWTGEEHRWTAAPEQYGAIHFHDDDLGDCGWEESFALDVPGDWPSGFYAAHLRNEAGEDLIPFFVRPSARAAPAAVAVLVPTFTYQVYSCFVRPGRGAENRDRASGWGALLETPDMNPQFGLSAYNEHSDGAGVCITSMHRPQLDTRPRQMSLMDPAPGGSGTQRIGCDRLPDRLARSGRRGPRRRHRPRPARRRARGAGALSRRHRRPAPRVLLGPDAGRAGGVSRRGAAG